MMMNCFGGKDDLLKALNEEAAPEVFYKKQVLNNFPKFTRKKRLWYRCFPENSAKFLRTPFLHNTFGRLLPKRYFQPGPLPEVLTITNLRREQDLYLHRPTWIIRKNSEFKLYMNFFSIYNVVTSINTKNKKLNSKLLYYKIQLSFY